MHINGTLKWFSSRDFGETPKHSLAETRNVAKRYDDEGL
jgi:hypothetical protein